MPLAPEILMERAWAALATSALGFKVLIAAMTAASTRRPGPVRHTARPATRTFQYYPQMTHYFYINPHHFNFLLILNT